jgi:hypothetical protein
MPAINDCALGRIDKVYLDFSPMRPILRPSFLYRLFSPSYYRKTEILRIYFALQYTIFIAFYGGKRV